MKLRMFITTMILLSFSLSLFSQPNLPLNLFYFEDIYPFGKTETQIRNFYSGSSFRNAYTAGGDKTLEYISNEGMIVFYFDENLKCNKIKAGEMGPPFVNELIYYCRTKLNYVSVSHNEWKRKTLNALYFMERASDYPIVYIHYIDREGLRKIGKEHLLD